MTHSFSPSTKGWYSGALNYPSPPDDLIEVPDALYKVWANTPDCEVLVLNGAVVVRPRDYQRPESTPAPPRAAPPPSTSPSPPPPAPEPSEDDHAPKPVHKQKPPAKPKKSKQEEK